MLKFLAPVALILTFAFQAVGQSPKGEQSPRANGQAASTRAVEEAIRGYAAALRAGVADPVVEFYTTDGELLLPGLAPLRGREALRAFLSPLVGSTEVESVEMKSELTEVHGETADSWGTYRQVAGERGKPKQTFGGRYASLWRLEGDGHWRLVRLMMQPMPSDAQ